MNKRQRLPSTHSLARVFGGRIPPLECPAWASAAILLQKVAAPAPRKIPRCRIPTAKPLGRSDAPWISPVFLSHSTLPARSVKVLISLEINVLCNHRLMVSAAEPTHRKKFINFEDFSCVGEVPGLESPRSRIVHASSVSLLWGTPASQALTKTQIRTTNTIP